MYTCVAEDVHAQGALAHSNRTARGMKNLGGTIGDKDVDVPSRNLSSKN